MAESNGVVVVQGTMGAQRNAKSRVAHGAHQRCYRCSLRLVLVNPSYRLLRGALPICCRIVTHTITDK